MTDQDTREKLEADVEEICWGKNNDRYFAQKRYLQLAGVEADDGGVMANHEGHVLMTVIMHLLDRQAAITERNNHGCTYYDITPRYCQSRDIDAVDLRTRVAELEAKPEAHEQTHMQLPMDADGMPIRVGDWMERVGGGGNDYTKVARCVAISNNTVLFKGKNIVGNAPETLIKQNKASNWRRCLVNADGEVIRKGEFVYGADGRGWLVTGFDWEHTHPVCAEDAKGRTKQLKPSWCSHTCPDSLKRIADELREIGADTYRHSGTADLDSLADRIERLM